MQRPGGARRVVLAVYCAGVALLGAAALSASPQSKPAAAPISFNRDVRPILANNCFTCHGPDEQKRKTTFHLDTREGAFAEDRIIVPGNAARSLLIWRITHEDPQERMPPIESGHALTDKQIGLLRQWIDEGARWDGHWAFTAPARAEPPPVRKDDWARNPIDRFILARLERERLKPSPEADRATLLRRLYLDLTGLPPAPADVDAFLADRSPDAYERRVDQLLASPRYGERLAVPWLDASRYADTHGYHIDSHREMWPWRNWVIDAFNRNLPFDRFVIEQLAGDLLPNPTREQQIASGFNRNHMINFEGGAIADEYQVEYVVDRVEATSSAFMGLTMGCARCHSHKFDPISQKEFYQFFAFFNNVPEVGLDGRVGNARPFLLLPSHEQETMLDELGVQIEAREIALADATVAPLQVAWEKTVVESGVPAIATGLVAHYELDGSFSDMSGRYQHGRAVTGEPTFEPGQLGRAATFDGDTEVSFGVANPAAASDAFSLAAWLRPRGNLPINVIQKLDDTRDRRGLDLRLDDIVLVDIQRWAARLTVSLASAAPGQSIELRTRNRLTFGDWYHVAVSYDGSGKAAGLRLFLDGKPAEVDVVRDAVAGSIRNDAAVRVGSPTLGKPYVGQIDDLRLYDRAIAPQEAEQIAVHHAARSIVMGVTGRRTREEAARVREHFLMQAAPDPLRAAHAELKALRREKVAFEKRIPSAMVMGEREKLRDTFILARGDYRNQTEKVQPGVPAVLPPLPAGVRADRLALARWLVQPDHPLTARVAVNRFWQMYFGHGIVKTQEDFGVQGEPPIHPELLDWLATEFIRSGWDVKATQRLIVTSATYRQDSRVSAELLERDPENRLLARGTRMRLPAEMIRDAALAASGLLTEQIGGPSVLPYQPPGLWEELAFGDGFSAQSYQQGRGKDLYRRTMYTFWKRTAPPASLATFDAPDREKCTARRPMTNTPLQALVLLNDPTYVEAARALATRGLLEGGVTPASRVTHLFRLATGRAPAKKELQVLETLLQNGLRSFGERPRDATQLLRVGDSVADKRLDPVELAAWTTVASVVLNLDETITKQ